MKSLNFAAIIAAASLCAGCARRVELIAIRPSPDGAIIAAFNINSGEFPFEEQYYEVRLYPRSGRLSNGEVILSYGEDDSRPVFRWISTNSLRVQLPCGWWSSLTNHYQLPGTSRIIDIAYDPAPAGCSRLTISSTDLPPVSH
jgi:hypothetical protein